MPILPDYPRVTAVKRLGAKWPVTASIDIRERGGGGGGGAGGEQSGDFSSSCRV